MADQDPDEKILSSTDQEQRNRAVDIAQGNVAPNTLIGEPLPGQPAPGVYLGASGENLGTTQGTTPPQGVTGVQGQLSPEEKTFWSANPFGAVKDPQTGALVGLGGTGPEAQRIAAQYPQTPVPTYTGVGAPQPPGPPPDTGQRQPMSVQDFYSPILRGRINDFDQAISESADRMRRANTQAPRHGISDFQKEADNLSQLHRGRQALATELHQTAQLAFETQHQNTQMQKEQNIAMDARAATAALGNITAAPGTLEYKKAVAQIDAQYPYARQNPKMNAALIDASLFHDEREKIAEKAKAAGLVEQIEGYGQKGPSIKYVNPQAVPQKNQTRYDVLQAAIKGHLEQSDVEAKKNAGTENVPYSNASTLHAQQAEAASLEKQFPGLNPRNQLARKALDDPNASEEHKAAARKILGLQ